MTRPVVLIGAGGHARVLVSALKACSRRIAGCLALEQPGSGWPRDISYLGDDDYLSDLSPDDMDVMIAVGSIRASPRRAEIYAMVTSHGFAVAGIAHPSAIVDSGAELGQGAQVMAGAIVQAGAAVGVNTIINTGAIIEHDCRVGDHAHVATGAILAGDVVVESGAHIGAGATVLQGRRIGAGATVGAGACVTKDVSDGAVVTGIPARTWPANRRASA